MDDNFKFYLGKKIQNLKLKRNHRFNKNFFIDDNFKFYLGKKNQNLKLKRNHRFNKNFLLMITLNFILGKKSKFKIKKKPLFLTKNFFIDDNFKFYLGKKIEKYGKHQKPGQGTTAMDKTRRACKWGEVGTEQTTNTSPSSANLSTELQTPPSTSVEVRNNKIITKIRNNQTTINK